MLCSLVHKHIRNTKETSKATATTYYPTYGAATMPFSFTSPHQINWNKSTESAAMVVNLWGCTKTYWGRHPVVCGQPFETLSLALGHDHRKSTVANILVFTSCKRRAKTTFTSSGMCAMILTGSDWEPEDKLVSTCQSQGSPSLNNTLLFHPLYSMCDHSLHNAHQELNLAIETIQSWQNCFLR